MPPPDLPGTSNVGLNLADRWLTQQEETGLLTDGLLGIDVLKEDEVPNYGQ